MSIKSDLTLIKNHYTIQQLINLKNLYSSDKIAAKMSFNMLIDCFCKDGIISQNTAQNVYISKNKRHDIVMYCKSYSVKLI